MNYWFNRQRIFHIYDSAVWKLALYSRILVRENARNIVPFCLLKGFELVEGATGSLTQRANQ